VRIERVPTLAVQRRLYELPRSPERFTAYLRELSEGQPELRLPLTAFNPMGRDHVAEALDRLIAAGADEVAGHAAEAAARELAGVDESLRVTLVLADDIGGMWTHRRTVEFQRRWGKDHVLRLGWCVALAWTSDMPDAAALTAEVRGALFRAAYRRRHGDPTVVEDLVRLEALSLEFAGREPDTAIGAASTRAALEAIAGSRTTAAAYAALFGDAAASEIGYPAVGLEGDAAVRLVLQDIRRAALTPRAALLGASPSSP
jgi:hypothetical protein